MKMTSKMNMTKKIKITSKWRQPEDDFKIEDDLKKRICFYRQSPALAYMTLVVIVFTKFCCIFFQLYEESILSIGQWSYKYLILYPTIFEYIFKKITNIEYIHNRTAYRIQILNIFVFSNLAKYEYRIDS